MTDTKPRIVAAFGGVFFGLVVAGMGAFFVFALWVGFGRAKETRGWQQTPCVIIRSEIVEQRPTPNSPLAFLPVVHYRYQFDGQSYTGTNIKRIDGPTSHPKRAQAKLEKYPLDRQLDCWVNPADPGQAVLKHGTLAPLYSIWFPGLFVVAGLGISVASVLRARGAKAQ